MNTLCKEEIEKAKPILFNTEMVKAIQDGRKVQTRRVVEDKEIIDVFLKNGGNKNKTEVISRLSKYKKGDVLWVRETFWAKHDSDCWDSGQSFDCGVDLKENDFEIQYVASPVDKNQPDIPVDCYPTHTDENGDLAGCVYGEWQYYSKHPSVHMPKKYARIFLKVTDVRVERLQDIRGSHNDILAEGLPKDRGYLSKPNISKKEILEWWINLWNSTSKDGDKWEDNPFVFVYEFEVMK